jgi:hypothetical protein
MSQSSLVNRQSREEQIMAKASWFDEKAQHPTLHERVEKLESFTAAMADGVVDKKELDGQEQRLTTAMKALEPKLSDELHAQVTSVMIELTAYNVMRLLHELQTERVRLAVGGTAS